MGLAFDGAQDEPVVWKVNVPDGDAFALVVMKGGGEDGGVEVLLQLLVGEVDGELLE